MFSAALIINLEKSLIDIYEELYSIFHDHFIKSRVYLAKSIYVNPGYHGKKNGKENIFWHIVTRTNNKTKEREFDTQRASRIHWIKPIIENYNNHEIKLFYADYNKKIRLFLWAEDYDFVVILQKLGNNYSSYLVTSFYIEEWKKKKFQKMYENYINGLDKLLKNCEWF